VYPFFLTARAGNFRTLFLSAGEVLGTPQFSSFLAEVQGFFVPKLVYAPIKFSDGRELV
jgi:hypothetical protein